MAHAPAWNLSPRFFRSPRLSLSIALALGAAGSCAPPQAANRAVVRGGDVDSGATGRRDAAIPDLQPTPEADAAPDLSPRPAPSPARDAAASPVAPDGRPPPADARTPPAAQIEVTQAAPGAAVTDLGLEGTLDWAHFGFQASTTVNRKRSASAPLILVSSLGASFSGRSSPEFAQFLWSDGMPTPAGRNVLSGFESASGLSGGFQVTVQGDPARSRTVKLYVGAIGSGARLTARFGSFGPPVHVDRSLTAETVQRNRVYTVVFRPSMVERTLVLEWTIEAPDARPGNVRLQAVTLAETEPVE